jgi:nucleotide-binding universal stress UspA family protein
LKIFSPFLTYKIHNLLISLKLKSGTLLAVKDGIGGGMMERILVGMDPVSASLWAGLHALSLAKRINASVCFLFVLDPETPSDTGKMHKNPEVEVKKRVGQFAEQAQAEKIVVDYYVTEGNYENELIRLIQEKRITLLVLGAPSGRGVATVRFSTFLERIRHRVNCRIEVVHEKNLTADKEREDDDVARLSTHRGQ